MPKRCYKWSTKKEKIKERDASDGDQFLEPQEKAAFVRNAETELDRLFAHTSEALKQNENHYTFPAFNVGKVPLQTHEFRIYPDCDFSEPKAVYVADNQCEGIDICHRRTLARELHRKRLLTASTKYQAVQKNKKLKTDKKNGVYHMSLYDLAERLENDPDPYFHGSYDYYFSGGNVSVLPESGSVVHVDGTELNDLNIGTFSDNLHRLNATSKRNIPFGEIFETRSVLSFNKNHSECFAVRQRNNITLHSWKPSGAITMLLRLKNKTPFISLAQLSEDVNTFIVTTMKQELFVYDLNQKLNPLQAKHRICPKNNDDLINWNMVKPWSGQTLIYANERQFFPIDLRTSPTEWLNSSCVKIKNYECDFISAISKSEFCNLAYVATSHKLHCLDIRYLGRDLESSSGALCSWTHQLQHAPAFFDTFRYAGSEFIALSSALADDLHICELSRDLSIKEEINENMTSDESKNVEPTQRKTIYKSHCLPYKPMTLEQTYQQARLSGKCLQPEVDLQARMQRCTTGMAFFDNSLSDKTNTQRSEEFATLITANSIGDVYAHSIRECHSQELRHREIIGGEEIHDYAQKVYDNIKPELRCTEVVDLKAMLKVFRCEALSKDGKDKTKFDDLLLDDEEDKNETQHTTVKDDKGKAKVDFILPRRYGLGRWQKSIQTLHSYKDALVKDILSIWDIDYNDEPDIKLSHIDKKFNDKPDPESIVSSWLNSNMQSDLPQVNEQEFNDSFTTRIYKSTDRLNYADDFAANISTQQQSTQLLIEDSALTMQQNSLLTPLKPKIAKKKSKYVKGF